MGGNYSALLVTRKVSAVLLYSSLGRTLVEKKDSDKLREGPEKKQKE